jgi:glycosyltransferase involved in cell wall biosynthesis
VVGPDDRDGSLRDLRRALDRLRFHRAVIVSRGLWGSDKAAVFADADALCLPSATENFGNAPAEAAALGVPVVVSRECGVAEFLDPDATSVVDHTDVRAVSRGIERALGDDAHRAAQESAGEIRRSLSWTRMAARQSEVYEGVVDPLRSKRTRVVLTVPSLRRSFGGPAVQALPFAEAIRHLGYDVRVVGCDAEGRSAIDLGRIGSFHGTPVPRRLAPLARSVRRADVVHVTGFRDPVGTLASLRARAPLVIEPMGMHRRRLRSDRIKTAFDRTLGLWAMRRAEVVVATSTLERDELVADGVAPDRIVIRPNGIDVDGDAKSGWFRTIHAIPAEVPLVVALGRITAKKGLPLLVEAVARMPGCWLAVVGPDDGDGSLERLWRDIGRCDVGERTVVETIGRWGSDRAGVLADSDAFCLPSETENFGNAAAEAAASGLPVVISDRCGVAEFLPEGSTAIVPFGDLDALRGGLEWALQPDIREQAEWDAPALRSRLSWPNVAAEQVSIYDRILR